MPRLILETAEQEALRHLVTELRYVKRGDPNGVPMQRKPTSMWFRIPVQFLDTTNHYDYGYKGLEWAQRNYIAINGHPPPKGFLLEPFVPRSRLSDSRNLSARVLGFKSSVLAEHSWSLRNGKNYPDGTRRCMIVHNPTRTRCRAYTKEKSCVCPFHQKIMSPNTTLAIQVRNTPLAEIIARRTQDPAYRSIREEIGLMRSMLELLVKEFQYEPGVAIDRGHMNAVMQSCRMIGEQVKTLTDIDMRMNSRLSIEQIGNIAEQFAELVIKLFNPDVEQCKALETGLGGIINPLRVDGVEGVPDLEGENSEEAMGKFVDSTTGVYDAEDGTHMVPGLITDEVIASKAADNIRLTAMRPDREQHAHWAPIYREFLPPGVSRQCDALKHFIPMEPT